MKLSIVIPIYNEKSTVLAILEKIAAVDLGNIEKEIVLVDDASTDGSREILEQLKIEENAIQVFFHEKNRGKGAALRTGFEHVRGDYVVVQDADLEYDPQDFKMMMDVVCQDNLDVLYGSRILEPSNRKHASLKSYLGGRLLTLITNTLYGTRLTDEPTCYKLFRREVLMDLNLRCERFEFCPEVTAKVARRGIPIVEVPIHYYPRSWDEGKKIGWWDFVEAVWVLVRERVG